MADLRAAAQQALDALDHIGKIPCSHEKGICRCEYRFAAKALRDALEQQAESDEQPPSMSMFATKADWQSVLAQLADPVQRNEGERGL